MEREPSRKPLKELDPEEAVPEGPLPDPDDLRPSEETDHVVEEAPDDHDRSRPLDRAHRHGAANRTVGAS